MSQHRIVPRIKTPRKAIFNYKLKQKPYREFYHKMNNAYKSYLQNKFFSSWVDFSNKSRSTKVKLDQIRNIQKAKRINFNAWRSNFLEKKNIREKVEALTSIMSRYPSQLFFDKLVNFVASQIENELADEKAVLSYVRNLRSKAFFGWIICIKKLLNKRRANELAGSTYYENIARKSFVTLKEYTKYQLEKKSDIRQSLVIYAFNIMKKY